MTARYRPLYAGGLAAIMLAGGCGVLYSRSAPISRTYQLVAQPVSVTLPTNIRVDLRTVGGSPPFQDNGIAYQTSQYRLDNYRFRRWIAAPTDMIAERLRDLLYRPSPMGQASAAAPVSLLDARVKAFQEVDEGDRISGLVEIEFCIFPSDPFARAQWCKTIRRETPASDSTPDVIVQAISKANNEVIAQFASDLSEWAVEQSMKQSQMSSAPVK